jgi:hypothetical protein
MGRRGCSGCRDEKEVATRVLIEARGSETDSSRHDKSEGCRSFASRRDTVRKMI